MSPFLVILQAFFVAFQVLFLLVVAPSPLVVACLVFTVLMFFVTLLFWAAS